MHMHNAGPSVQHDEKGKIAKIATMVKDSPKPIDQLHPKNLLGKIIEICTENKFLTLNCLKEYNCEICNNGSSQGRAIYQGRSSEMPEQGDIYQRQVTKVKQD